VHLLNPLAGVYVGATDRMKSSATLVDLSPIGTESIKVGFGTSRIISACNLLGIA
jgi:hypothetical protein